VGPMQPVLIALMASICFVLLITCANVAGLLLARSVTRQREIAIRAALGAKPWRGARQLLTESVMLALLGGAAGLLLAYWAVPAMISFFTQEILNATPQVQNLSVNGGVLLFSFALSVLTGILFGLVPAFQAFKSKLHAELQEAGRGSVSSGHR